MLRQASRNADPRERRRRWAKKSSEVSKPRLFLEALATGNDAIEGSCDVFLRAEIAAPSPPKRSNARSVIHKKKKLRNYEGFSDVQNIEHTKRPF